MPKFKDNALEAILFSFHQQGLTPDGSHKLLQSVTGEDPMSLDEVSLFFKTIDCGSFSLKERTLEEKIQFALEQPTVHDRVLANLDFSSRLALTETSTLLRQLSFDRPIHINELEMLLGNDGAVEVLIDDSFEWRVELVPNLAGSRKAVNSLNGFLSNILKFKRLTVDTLKFYADKVWKGQFILKRFKATLSEIEKSPLRVKNFKAKSPFVLDFLTLIPFLNPSYLNNIKVDSSYGYAFGDDSVEDVWKSESWKNASSFSSPWIYWEFEFVEHCFHFSFFCVRLEEFLTVQMFTKVKEEILKNSQLRQFKIFLSLGDIYTDQIREAIGSQSSEWVHFNYPEGAKQLSVRVTENLIWFKGPCYVEGEDGDEGGNGDDEEADEEEY